MISRLCDILPLLWYIVNLNVPQTHTTQFCGESNIVDLVESEHNGFWGKYWHIRSEKKSFYYRYRLINTYVLQWCSTCGYQTLLTFSHFQNCFLLFGSPALIFLVLCEKLQLFVLSQRDLSVFVCCNPEDNALCIPEVGFLMLSVSWVCKWNGCCMHLLVNRQDSLLLRCLCLWTSMYVCIQC